MPSELAGRQAVNLTVRPEPDTHPAGWRPGCVYTGRSGLVLLGVPGTVPG